jgi:hypothetical protein
MVYMVIGYLIFSAQKIIAFKDDTVGGYSGPAGLGKLSQLIGITTHFYSVYRLPV